MNETELIKETKKYFGKDRILLIEALKGFKFDESKINKWEKIIKNFTSHPFFITEGKSDNVTENIKNKNFNEIDMTDLGDLSLNIQILLNKDINSGYDWNKKLVVKCGGKANILQILVNFIIPAYTINTYYMIYNKPENYYEFGKISKLEPHEKEIIRKIHQIFKNLNYFYVNQKLAGKKYEELISDCNSDGNASIFDCLFSDIYNYQNKTQRFNDKQLISPTGTKISWKEYYNKSGELLYRQEWEYFKSKDSLCIITDKYGHITKLNLWRDFEDEKHCKFSYDIIKSYNLKKKNNKKYTAENNQVTIINRQQ